MAFLASLAPSAPYRREGGASGRNRQPPLEAALEAGVFLVKPNQREAKRLGSEDERFPDLARRLVHERRSDVVIVTLGRDGALYNDAAQAWNHWLYWQCLSPTRGGEPQEPLAGAIRSSFTSFEDFKEKFTESALDVFGSGWAWLVKTTESTVNIELTTGAENPMRYGRIVLMTCDMWERAFYIDYRNDKSAYLDAFWHVVS